LANKSNFSLQDALVPHHL